MIIAIEPFFFKLIGKEERNIEKIIPIIKNILKSLPKADIERRVFLRKFTGEANLKGLLDFVPENTKTIEFNEISLQDILIDDKFIIGPLNMDELDRFYKKILNNKTSIYPFTHKLLSSKFYRNIMFYPHVPIMVYVPEFSLFRIKDYDFNRFFKENNVDRVILKDEYGYHSGQAINYKIVPNHKINEELVQFKEKAKLVEDFGGIIVEEFLSDIKSEVYKCHIFNQIIPNEVLKYDVKLKGLEGTFKSYNKGDFQLLDDVKISIGKISNEIVNLLNPLIKQNLPYAFSSIDFLIFNNEPVVIDVNSKAGSLGEIQEITQSNDHNPFEFFYLKCKDFSEKEWEKQKVFLEKIIKNYLKIINLDGIFTAKSNKIINLLTTEEIILD